MQMKKMKMKTSKQQLHSHGKPSTDLFFALSMSAYV